MPLEKSPLLVFSDDWGRHPSSSQHLVRHLLSGRRVVWVNTIGTRRPRLCLGDLRRGFEKLRQWSAPAAASAEGSNPTVLNPVMWPDFASLAGRAVNPVLLGRAVTRAVEQHLGGEEPVVLTTVPLVAPLVGRIPAKRWVYYCVDDWSTWPGLDHATLDRAERQMLGRVDATAAVSLPLVHRLMAAGHRPTLITHGVDPQMWRRVSTAGDDHPTVAQLRRMPWPRAVFWGLIDTLLDAHAIRNLAAEFPGSVVLIGPEGSHAKQVTSIPGVTCLPAVPHAVLPAVARAADVLLMPYRPDYPSMKAAQPLKLMEYLATDRPVVCLDVVATQRWTDCCDVVSRDAFAATVIRRANVGADGAQLLARRQKLKSESWAAKAQLLESLLDGEALHEERRKAG